MPETILDYLLPWEFSPAALLAVLAAGAIYLRGWGRCRRRGAAGPGGWALAGFLSGLLMTYAVMQTHFDYLAQHMLWIHRLQHLVLHHVGPFLMVLGGARLAMTAGLPGAVRRSALVCNPLTLGLYRLVQQPVIATVLFVGLIGFWLIPSVHFTAMLSASRYQVMNWSMLLDGLLFWWLILNPTPSPGGKVLGFGPRIVMLIAVVPPQTLIGAHIAFAKTSLFSVYAVCGRAWPISPLVDQQIAGLLTWIPPGMMSVIASLVLLHRWLHSREVPGAGCTPTPA